jgi:hypothetical protein
MDNLQILPDGQVSEYFLVGKKGEPGHRRKDDHGGHERPGDDFDPQAVPPVFFHPYSKIIVL